MDAKAIARFWSRVDKKGPDDCWPWLGGCDRDGYGMLGKKRAHRVSYTLECGPIGPGLLIRHRCDNPPCVNPRHLLVGTQKDNSRDAVERRRIRQPWGETAGASKLTDAECADIRRRFAAGESASSIHRSYPKVRQKTVYRVARGVTRTNGSTPTTTGESGISALELRVVRCEHPGLFATAAECAEMRRLYASGKSCPTIKRTAFPHLKLSYIQAVIGGRLRKPRPGRLW